MTCWEGNNLHKANHSKPLLVPTDPQDRGEASQCWSRFPYAQGSTGNILHSQERMHPLHHSALSVIFPLKSFKTPETAAGHY